METQGFEIIGPSEKDLNWDILYQVEMLQKEIWGFKDLGPCYPARLYKVEAKIGGTPLIALKEGIVVGFLLGFAAYDREGPYIWSQIMGVHPSFQGKGIATALKMRQKEVAIERNIKRIEWTFDPLEARNALFNLSKLGAKGIKYEKDIYGTADGPMYALPADRLRVRWNVKEERERITEVFSSRDLPKALDAQNLDGVLVPKDPDFGLKAREFVAIIPENIRELISKEDKGEGFPPGERFPVSWKWRECVSKVLVFYMEKGWMVVNAFKDEKGTWLLLSKEGKNEET